MFEHIEKLKREYTDKYVVVDASRPELARFRNCVGQVKTVNMNGRALVQFDAWNNLAWYDIEFDFLKVVPKPEPKPIQEVVREKAPPAATNAKGAVVGKPAQSIRETDVPGSKPGVTRKPSTAEILAAARAKKEAAAAPAPVPPSGKMSTADILAAARAKKAAAANTAPSSPEKAAESANAKPVRPKLSTADILAAARAKKAANSADAPPAQSKLATDAELEDTAE